MSVFLVLLVLVLVLWTVQNEDLTDQAEIFTEASSYALTQSKLGGTWSDSDSSNADSKFDDFDDSDQAIDDFQSFFGQMNTECDVDCVQRVLNVVPIPGPPNRQSNRVRIDRQSDLLAIFKMFLVK